MQLALFRSTKVKVKPFEMRRILFVLAVPRRVEETGEIVPVY